MSKGIFKSDDVVITGRGMVSSLGLDFYTSCAAARADITRSKELDYYKFCSLETGLVENAMGHPVSILTDGFEGNIRLVRLFVGALSDLQKNTVNAPWSKGKTTFYLSLPEGDYTEDEVFEIIELALQLSGWDGEWSVQFISYSGHTGALNALNRAKQDLESQLVDYAVVGGVDTLLDEVMLSQLHFKGLLKTSDNSIGIQPAEASAFVLLETAENANMRKALTLGIIENIQLGLEDLTFLSDTPCLGKGLTKVIFEVINNSKKIEDNDFLWLISDHNGELCRAVELGNVTVNINSQSKKELSEIWYPALSFGETGSAYGVIALVLVITAFERDYSPYSMGLVVASDYEKSRAAVLISNY